MTGVWEAQALRLGHKIINIRKDITKGRYIVGFTIADSDTPHEMYMSMDSIKMMDDAYKILLASLR